MPSLDILGDVYSGTGRKHNIRTPLTSAISRDEGETWENERIIAGDPYGDKRSINIRSGLRPN